MKTKTLLHLLLLAMLLGCKDDEMGLPDLSQGSFELGTYTGMWAVFFQQVDSIDVSGKPYFKRWPTEYGGRGFQLRSLNEANTLYERTITFEYVGDGEFYKYKDRISIDPATGIFTMPVYDYYGSITTKPDSIGMFIGKVRSDSYAYIYGYMKYRAYWYCSGCPMGQRDRYANAVVQANIH